uniref:FHA domain-containing protein n=1 Tax=Mycena chlorophos TaxID=658473 RepID=A0ABQ0MAZ1_MYCCL|nr:predicted protein [Mycena chlorophos]
MDLPGRFGTISLLRQNTVADVVTSFGVDATAVSFGRDPTCSVRLYYPDVAPVHARVVFNDAKKAFLEVIGDGGLSVDGCEVFPQRTIPLENGSEVVIHGKRFRFTYPPKDMRAALAASPARPANRALRLSMIASAQVFSPRPSSNPKENLRVLQSPLRAPPRRTPSPSPTKGKGQYDQDDETITLVQGAHPRVVEDEKDLVILEDVEITPPRPQAALPKTPRRQSLHRAVLIRSAHRAVLAANANAASPLKPPVVSPSKPLSVPVPQTQPQPVSPTKGTYGVPMDNADDEGDTDTDTDTEEEEAEVRALGLEVVSVSSGSESEEEEEEEEAAQRQQEQKARLGWRKSLERLWPFGRVKDEEEETVLPPAPANEDNANEDENDESDENEDENEEMNAPTPVRKTVVNTTPTQQNMTPRLPSKSVAPASAPGFAQPRPLPPFGMRGASRSPEKSVNTPFGPIRARSRSKSKSPEKPHPAARTPVGFGKPKQQEQQVVPMDVDEDEDEEEQHAPAKSLYAELAAEARKEAQTPITKTVTPKSAIAPETQAAPAPRLLNLANFMTPQAPRGRSKNAAAAAFQPTLTTTGPHVTTTNSVPARHSLAGGPQRIRIEESPWKAAVKVEDNSPAKPFAPPSTPATRVKVSVSEEERRAISERRRSALNAPDPDMFWADGAPGLSPRKSPTKRGPSVVDPVLEVKEEDASGQVPAEVDASAMLREMIGAVDGLKKRRESIMVDKERRASVAVAVGPLVLLGSGNVDQVEDMEVDEPEPDPAPAPKSSRRQAVATPVPTSPDEPTKRRGRKATADEPTTAAKKKTTARSRSTRRGAVAVEAESDVDVAQDEQEEEVSPPRTKPKTRRGRSVSKEPEAAAVPVAEKKTRRGRAATVEPESEGEVAAAAVVAQTGRKPRKPPPANAEKASAVPASEPVVATTTRRGRSATTTAAAPASAPERKTRTRSRAPVDNDGEDDGEAEEVEITKVVAPKRKAAAKKEKVKEEETEPVLAAATKGKKPAAPPATTKSRATKKAATPATAPAVLDGEKENEESAGEADAVAVPTTTTTKVRVSRSRKNLAKDVEEGEPQVQSVPRRTRATRATRV